MEIAPHISVDPHAHHGAPVITGTRMPVSIIIGSLAGGMSREEVSREYAITIEQSKPRCRSRRNWLLKFKQYRSLGIER